MTSIIRSASEPSCPNEIAYLKIKDTLKCINKKTYKAAMQIFNDANWYMVEASSSYHTYSEQMSKGTHWNQKASRLILRAADILHNKSQKVSSSDKRDF